MNSFIEIYQEFLKLALRLFPRILFLTLVFKLLDIDPFSIFDFLSELKESIFYRIRGTKKLYSESLNDVENNDLKKN